MDATQPMEIAILKGLLRKSNIVVVRNPKDFEEVLRNDQYERVLEFLYY